MPHYAYCPFSTKSTQFQIIEIFSLKQLLYAYISKKDVMLINNAHKCPHFTNIKNLLYLEWQQTSLTFFEHWARNSSV